MDDQSGKLIDGTARAGQWRRSRPRPAAVDGAEVRSDAPKSIASSLLVPAEMLAPDLGSPLENGSISAETDDLPTTNLSGSPRGPENPASPEHINPFLAAGPLAFGSGDAADRRGSVRRFVSKSFRRQRERWTAGRGARVTACVAVALVAVVAGGLVVRGVGQSVPSAGVLAQSLGAGTTRSLERLTPGLFASNPFDLEKPVTQSASKVAPRLRPHPSRGTASRPLRPATVGARGERSRSTSTGADHPSTSIAVARAVTPQVQSSPHPATTETPAPAVVSQHTTSSNVSAEPAGSSGRPAFGSDGLLGPGHSPDS